MFWYSTKELVEALTDISTPEILERAAAELTRWRKENSAADDLGLNIVLISLLHIGVNHVRDCRSMEANRRIEQ
jgi:hypothetical protein